MSRLPKQLSTKTGEAQATLRPFAGNGLRHQPTNGAAGGTPEAEAQSGGSERRGGARSARGTSRANALAQIRSAWCQLELSKAMLTATEHLTGSQGREGAEAGGAGNGGVDAELAVGAATGVVINNGAAVHEHTTLELAPGAADLGEGVSSAGSSG